MWLDGTGGRRLALCYSMNVHPGEGMDDVLSGLRGGAGEVKRALGAEGPFCVGLRLARRAAEEFAVRGDELRDELERLGLVALTANAFPYGDFHKERVKEEVYLPDWSDGRRAVYTLRVAVALAALGNRGSSASVSTLPLAFRATRCSMNAVTGRLLETVSALQSVERKSGVRVALALEPEPFCLLGGARDAIAYWRDTLLPAARARFGRGGEEVVRAYLGVCLDTCHHAVVYEENPVDAYREAGVPIVKMQLSCALEAPSIAALRPFEEARYLHQVMNGAGEGREDLPGPEIPGPVRCHFHVPVHRDEVGGLRTTRREMAAMLRRAIETDATRCFEIETYTWDVLPFREGTLVDSLAAEYRSVLDLLAPLGVRPAAS